MDMTGNEVDASSSTPLQSPVDSTALSADLSLGDDSQDLDSRSPDLSDPSLDKQGDAVTATASETLSGRSAAALPLGELTPSTLGQSDMFLSGLDSMGGTSLAELAVTSPVDTISSVHVDNDTTPPTSDVDAAALLVEKLDTGGPELTEETQPSTTLISTDETDAVPLSAASLDALGQPDDLSTRMPESEPSVVSALSPSSGEGADEENAMEMGSGETAAVKADASETEANEAHDGNGNAEGDTLDENSAVTSMDREGVVSQESSEPAAASEQVETDEAAMSSFTDVVGVGGEDDSVTEDGTITKDELSMFIKIEDQQADETAEAVEPLDSQIEPSLQPFAVSPTAQPAVSSIEAPGELSAASQLEPDAAAPLHPHVDAHVDSHVNSQVDLQVESSGAQRVEASTESPADAPVQSMVAVAMTQDTDATMRVPTLASAPADHTNTAVEADREPLVAISTSTSTSPHMAPTSPRVTSTSPRNVDASPRDTSASPSAALTPARATAAATYTGHTSPRSATHTTSSPAHLSEDIDATPSFLASPADPDTESMTAPPTTSLTAPITAPSAADDVSAPASLVAESASQLAATPRDIAVREADSTEASLHYGPSSPVQATSAGAVAGSAAAAVDSTTAAVNSTVPAVDSAAPASDNAATEVDDAAVAVAPEASAINGDAPAGDSGVTAVHHDGGAVAMETVMGENAVPGEDEELVLASEVTATNDEAVVGDEVTTADSETTVNGEDAVSHDAVGAVEPDGTVLDKDEVPVERPTTLGDKDTVTTDKEATAVDSEAPAAVAETITLREPEAVDNVAAPNIEAIPAQEPEPVTVDEHVPVNDVAVPPSDAVMSPTAAATDEGAVTASTERVKPAEPVEHVGPALPTSPADVLAPTPSRAAPASRCTPTHATEAEASVTATSGAPSAPTEHSMSTSVVSVPTSADGASGTMVTTPEGTFTIDASGTGHGTVASENGDLYTGAYVQWKRHGRGVQHWHTGEMFSGIWEDDRQRQGLYTDKWGNQWEGDFFTMDVRRVYTVAPKVKKPRAKATAATASSAAPSTSMSDVEGDPAALAQPALTPRPPSTPPPVSSPRPRPQPRARARQGRTVPTQHTAQSPVSRSEAQADTPAVVIPHPPPRPPAGQGVFAVTVDYRTAHVLRRIHNAYGQPIVRAKPKVPPARVAAPPAADAPAIEGATVEASEAVEQDEGGVATPTAAAAQSASSASQSEATVAPSTNAAASPAVSTTTTASSASAAFEYPHINYAGMYQRRMQQRPTHARGDSAAADIYGTRTNRYDKTETLVVALDNTQKFPIAQRKRQGKSGQRSAVPTTLPPLMRGGSHAGNAATATTTTEASAASDDASTGAPVATAVATDASFATTQPGTRADQPTARHSARSPAKTAAMQALVTLPPVNRLGLRLHRGERFKAPKDNFPGPGAYNADHEKVLPRAPAFSLPYYGMHCTEAEVRRRQWPGPGDYTPAFHVMQQRAPVAGFGSKLVCDVDDPAFALLPRDEVPGPGAYPRTLQLHHSGLATFHAPTDKRQGPQAVFTTTNHETHPGVQYLSKDHLRDAIGWFSPGPAAYLVPSDLGSPHRAKITIKGKNKETIHSILPLDPIGPNTYDPYRAEERGPRGQQKNYIASHHRNVPSVSMGRATKQLYPALNPDTQLYYGPGFDKHNEGIFSPGPAVYNTARDAGVGTTASSFKPHNILVPDMPKLQKEAAALLAARERAPGQPSDATEEAPQEAVKNNEETASDPSEPASLDATLPTSENSPQAV